MNAKPAKQFLSPEALQELPENIDEALRQLEEQELALLKGNAGLEQQKSDLKEMMKMVDAKYDEQARDLIKQNRVLEK